MNNPYIYINRKKQVKKDIIDMNNGNNTIKKERKSKIKRQCINKEILNYLIEMIEFIESDEKKIFNIILLNTLLYFTGCRIGEILILDKSNIKELFEKEEYNIYCPKTKTNRKIYLSLDGKNSILKYLNVNENDFFNKLNEKGLVNLYNNKLDKRISYYWMEQYFKLLTKNYYDHPNPNNEIVYNFHSFRTNYINTMCRASNNIDEVSKLIGHKNIYTTFIYWRENHIDKEKIKNTLNKALL
jgi:site-specific recombinase XerD